MRRLIPTAFVCAAVLTASLTGCYGGTLGDTSGDDTVSIEEQAYGDGSGHDSGEIPSLRTPGKWLDEEGVQKERLMDDYEMQMDFWNTDYQNYLNLLDRGQPEIDFPQYREEIERWANEIIYYDLQKVPDVYKSTHQAWIDRATELRMQVR